MITGIDNFAGQGKNLGKVPTSPSRPANVYVGDNYDKRKKSTS